MFDLENELAKVSFFLDDISLYLDTHPNDDEALALYHEFHKKREEIVREYEKMCGPISHYEVNDMKEWTWNKTAWPWMEEE